MFAPGLRNAFQLDIGWIPFLLLIWGAATGDLGANPLERVTDVTGQWGLRFLLITLAVTPLRRLTGWSDLLRFRRMLGLFAFFYVSLHFVTWVWLDQELKSRPKGGR